MDLNFMNKTTFTCLLALGFMLGCVATPDEVTEQKQSKRQQAVAAAENKADEMNANVPDPSMGIQTVSSESEEGGPFEQTGSGLRYKIIKAGSGKKPRASSTVLCHYRGWLDNGTEFDSSYKRGEPTEFPLSGVIPAWTEGVQLIGEGGEIELDVPSKLGYGPRGMPGAIPPNARLHFRVELVKIVR